MNDSLPRPRVAHYENEWVKLADGRWHEVLLEFVKEQESSFKKMEMLFRVHQHRVDQGAMVAYNPPKSFNTSAKEFAILANKAADEGQPAFWTKAMFKSNEWVFAPSDREPTVKEELVREAMRDG